MTGQQVALHGDLFQLESRESGARRCLSNTHCPFPQLNGAVNLEQSLIVAKNSELRTNGNTDSSQQRKQ